MAVVDPKHVWVSDSAHPTNCRSVCWIKCAILVLTAK
jgi:hypothetical protein